MNRLIRYVSAGCLGAIIGWACLEPWKESFSNLRDFFLLYSVSIGIALFIIIEKFFFAQKDFQTILQWVKEVLKTKQLYIIPLIGVIFIKLMVLYLGPDDNHIHGNDKYVRFLILDISDSMSNQPVKELKRAVSNYLEIHRETNSNDRIGAITFSSDTKLLFSPQKNYDTMISAINKLKCYGSTKMEPALSMAYHLLSKQDMNQTKEMILVSDGIPNKPKSVLKVISDFDNIAVHTIGVGKTYDRDLLKQISTITNGQFFPANNVKQLTGVFKKIAMQNLTQSSTNSNRMFILPFWQRLLGWAVCGLLIGMTIGVVNQKKEMIFIGSTGGFFGGAISAILFMLIDFIHLTSGAITRFLSFSVLGACIGFTIYIVDYLYSKLIRVDGHFDISKLKAQHRSLQSSISQ